MQLPRHLKTQNGTNGKHINNAEKKPIIQPSNRTVLIRLIWEEENIRLCTAKKSSNYISTPIKCYKKHGS